jgi:putative membrane protein
MAQPRFRGGSKMTRTFVAAIVMSGLVTGVQTGFAQTPAGQPAGQDRGRSSPQAEGRAAGDVQTFIRRAAESGMKEVEAGKQAQAQATNEQVKAFAQRMVQDHSKANQELMVIAETKGVDLKAARGHDMKAMGKGPDFDRAYMAQMVKDHTDAVRLFEQQAGRDADPEVKAFAQKTLPTLREHLEMARSIQQQLGRSDR